MKTRVPASTYIEAVPCECGGAYTERAKNVRGDHVYECYLCSKAKRLSIDEVPRVVTVPKIHFRAWDDQTGR